jgi:hypothetical protein
MLTVAWYRFGATFRQRWTVYLTVVLLVALVGGIAMGSIAGARRTQSAFPTYLATSQASDLQFQTYSPQSLASFTGLTNKLKRLPQVTRVAIAPYVYLVPC